MLHLSRRILSAVLTIAVVAPAARAQNAAAGWTVSMKMTSDSGNGTSPFVMYMKQQYQGGKVRVQVDSSTMPNAAAVNGSYTIISVPDSGMINVVPTMHVAMKMPFSLLTGALHMSMPTPHFTVDRVEDLGSGGAIVGHETRRYRRTLEGSLDYTLGNRACTRGISQVGEYWITPDLSVEEDVEAAMKSTHGFGGFDFGMGASAMRGNLPAGTSLRAIIKSTEPDAQGKSRVVTTTVEYLALSHDKVDDLAFQAPLDYNTQDMGELMGMMPASMVDSVMAASAERSMHVTCKAPPKP